MNEQKKTLLQKNASWPLLVVYLGYLIGMFYVQQATYGALPSDTNFTAFALLTIILGVVLVTIFYNLAKLIVAKIIHYQMFYFSFLGLIIERDGKKKRVLYDITRFFDIAMQFVPEDNDINRNPTPIFLGGLIGFAVYAAIACVLFGTLAFGSSNLKVLGWGALFSLVFGFVLILYEMIPLKQDAVTDIYNIIMTRDIDDRKAFNIMQVNAKNELSGEEYVYPDFSDYESFYRAQTLYYHYLDLLYQNRLEEAVSAASTMKNLTNYLPDDQVYLPTAELVYFRYLINDDVTADNLYRTLKSDERKYVRSPLTLSGYRTAILVIGNSSDDKEVLHNLIDNYKKLSSSLTQSNRVVCEEKLFKQAYENIRKKRPELGLSELN